MVPALHIQLLGSFQLTYHEVPLPAVSSIRLRHLLAWLVLHRHAPQARLQLAYQFWPESSETQARTNLRNLLYALRQALPKAGRVLVCEGQQLQWASGQASSDVAEFEAALGRAAQAEAGEAWQAAHQALQEAVNCYGGDLLPHCYEDWILPERERLSQMHMNALERLAQLCERQGDYTRAILYSQRLLQCDALRESTYRALIHLHALNGNRGDAMRVYRACRDALRQELEVEPSTMTRWAYERAMLPGAARLPEPGPPASIPPLVGRAPELAVLQAAWQHVAARGPQVAILVGEAGTGKTRLLEELLRWASRQGLASAYAECRAAGRSVPLAPLVDWLRARPLPLLGKDDLSEIARLLPEVLRQWPGTPAPAPLSAAWQRQRLFAALGRALQAGPQPLVLALDGLHWCDQETLEWLQFLFQHEPRPRVLCVATCLPAEMPDNRPAAQFLEALQNAGLLTRLELKPLDGLQTGALLYHLLGAEPPPALSANIFRQSEGNPSCIIDLARARFAEPSARKPVRLQQHLAARLERLSPPARHLAGLAAVMGSSFSLAALHQVSDLGTGAFATALDELCQRCIFTELSGGGYGFTHNLARRAAYAALSHTHLLLYEQRLAVANPAVQLEAPPGQLAFDL